MHPTSAVLPTSARPSVQSLITEMEDSIAASAEFIQRMQLNDHVRSCYWEGQSDDGRKHEDELGEEPLPFEGASDQRIRLADMLIAEQTDLCKAAMIGGRLNAEPVDSDTDPELAASVAPMLSYQMRQMKINVRNETDFLLDWRHAFGCAVLHVDWKEEKRLERATLTLDDLTATAVDADLVEAGLPDRETLAQTEQESQATGEPVPPEIPGAMAAVAQQTIEELQALILSPEREPRLLEILALHDPKMPKSEMSRVITQLRKGEVAEYYRPYTYRSLPVWETLLPLVDVFFPAFVRDLEDAPWIARVKWLTETQIRQRAALEEWPKDMLEAVLKRPGNALSIGDATPKWVLSSNTLRQRSTNLKFEEEQKLFQILEVHYVAFTPEGAACTFCEVIHGAIPDRSLSHKCIPHAHGQLPFREFRRSRKEARYLLSAKGIGEEVLTHQSAIKAQHDARTDRTSLILSPPAMVPMNRAGGRFNLGPNAQIPMRRSGTLEFLKPPPMDMDTARITQEEWSLVNQIYGRPFEDVPPSIVQTKQQALVNDWLTDLTAAMQMTFDLCLEHIDDPSWLRITGSAKPPLDIAHTDFTISFDVRDLNLEWLGEKLEKLTNFGVLNDSEGVVDRAALTSYIFSAIDPVLAKRIVMPKDQAAQKEEEDELTALAVIMSGEEPPQKPGQNHELRAQVLQRATQRSMEIQAKLQSSPQIAKVFTARLEYHLNQVQQQRNAVIGRTMQQPALAESL